MKDKLTYKILEDGYMIYLDGNAWIHQYEPHIPDKSKSYEENAIAQIEELVASHEKVQNQPSIEEQIADLEVQLAALKEQQINE